MFAAAAEATWTVTDHHRAVDFRPSACVCCVAFSPTSSARVMPLLCLHLSGPSSFPPASVYTPSLTPRPPVSNAQIKEEFSNGVSPGRPPSTAGGLPRSSPPGSARERALRPSGLNGNHDASPAVVGRAIAGGGGGRAARAAAVAASRAKEREAEAEDRKAAEAEDRKRAVARKKEVRGEEPQ